MNRMIKCGVSSPNAKYNPVPYITTVCAWLFLLLNNDGGGGTTSRILNSILILSLLTGN